MRKRPDIPPEDLLRARMHEYFILTHVPRPDIVPVSDTYSLP